MPSWNGPMLEDKLRFSDSSFSASASSEGHNASDSRLSSDSSWCAPASDENSKHYLQIDFGRQYRIYYFLIYGNDKSPKWVTKYYLNYTADLITWKTFTRVRNSGIMILIFN